MIKAMVKLFFHCLFRFHREWSYNRTEAFGCSDCKDVWWGEAPGCVKVLGWVKEGKRGKSI